MSELVRWVEGPEARERWFANHDVKRWDGPKSVVIAAVFDPELTAVVMWYGRYILRRGYEQLATAEEAHGIFAAEQAELILEAIARYQQTL